jgi:hypothetical protein
MGHTPIRQEGDVQRSASKGTVLSLLCAGPRARGVSRRENYAACTLVYAQHKALKRKDLSMYHISLLGIKRVTA